MFADGGSPFSLGFFIDASFESDASLGSNKVWLLTATSTTKSKSHLHKNEDAPDFILLYVQTNQIVFI